MLLSARVLNDVANVNSFEVAEALSWTEGDSVDLYVQLIDSSLDTDMKGFYPAGRRYMPPALSTLSVQLQNIDNAKVINRLAVQPFPEDASIWKVTILSTDTIHGSPQVMLTLTEPTRTIRGIVKNSIKIQTTSNVGC
jgi:hypothetical protein